MTAPERTVGISRQLGELGRELGLAEYRRGRGWWASPEEQERLLEVRDERRRLALNERRRAERAKVRGSSPPTRAPAGAMEKATAYAARLIADPLEQVTGRSRSDVWERALDVYGLDQKTPMPRELREVTGPTRGDVVAHLAASRIEDLSETKHAREARLRRAARREGRP